VEDYLGSLMVCRIRLVVEMGLGHRHLLSFPFNS
jgi:hypothetical protein